MQRPLFGDVTARRIEWYLQSVTGRNLSAVRSPPSHFACGKPMPVTKQNDLADRLQADDPDAIQQLLRQYGGAVLHVLTQRYTGILPASDLEDVVSIGLFRVWQHRHRFDSSKASLRSWFFRICENAARDVLKHGWHKARTLEISSESVTEPQQPTSSKPADHPASKQWQQLKAAIDELPETQRRIVLADAAAKDDVACSTWLAGELGITPGAVRVNRKRAMDKLRRLATDDAPAF